VKKVIVVVILMTFMSQSTSFAASSAAINKAYKDMYRKLANQGNTDAVSAVTYYDVQIKKAIGKILDRKVNCDTKSKNHYKAIAYDTSQPEIDQLISGFYLGYCNAK
jgi:PIN domain nuclease of toxin-antitoxin system